VGQKCRIFHSIVNTVSRASAALRTDWISKSSVHRHLRRIDRRDRYPESKLWGNTEGETGHPPGLLPLLYIRPENAEWGERSAEFFGRLHLEAHLGCSRALRGLMQRLELTLMETLRLGNKTESTMARYARSWGRGRTFLQRMMLVFMGLASGTWC